METEEIFVDGQKRKTFKNRPRVLPDLLAVSVEKFSGKEGFVSGKQRLTYREFGETVDRIAAGLQRNGITKGDRVALLLGIQIDFPMCFFALMKLGAIAVPLNTRFTGEELSFEIIDSNCKVLIVDEEYWPAIEPKRKQLDTIGDIFFIGNGCPENIRSIAELTKSDTEAFVPAEVSEFDDALILYTSGTTGKPKGAVLHQHGLIVTAMLTSNVMQLADDDKLICSVPLFHVTGLAMAMLNQIYSGITGVYLKTFKTGEFLKTIAGEKITRYIGVANVIWLMINHSDFDKYDFSSFRRIMIGGSPATEEMIKKIKLKLPHLDISAGYGLTESHGIVTTTPYEDAFRKIQAVGKALPLVDLKVVDEQGNALPPEGVGEILLHGVKVFKRYWNNPDATGSVLVDNWLYTGDIGKIDEEGFLYILDRKKDMINRGGEKVYSQEVENLIFNYSKVMEVAVVGVPDRVMGEAVKAVVALKPDCEATEEEIRKFCAAHLADFKVPKFIEFVQNLPRNLAGKVVKAALQNNKAGPGK